MVNVQLFFDYSGLPKDDADPGVFYDNFQTTQFDEVLQYVEFPVQITPGETFREHRSLYNSKTIGRRDLLFFFSWLKDKGVKHIIKVIVQDSTDCHCDEVIEKCLSPFHIDVLDSSKLDLDPEMLYNACPDVKELLHLRWGANNAILRAWGEPEGLRRLKLLNKIYLYYDQVDHFSLPFNFCHLPQADKMYRHRKSHHKGDEIAIALIDDGVDICEKAFRDRIIHGKSLGYY
ncbi:hypothetical protein TMatcc_010176 [Talaromyces marneffei ATCC 18224]